MLISLDISTSCTGISLFNNDYKLLELSYVKFKKQKGENNLFKKLDEFIEYFKKYEQLEITEVAIESSLLAFKGKFSNALTIQKLTQFNAMISTFLYKKLNVEPIYYSVTSARKLAFPNLTIPQQHPNKKYLIWETFSQLHPEINWEYSKKTHKLIDETFDAVDSAIIGLAHIVSKIKAKEQIAKNSTATAKS